MPVCIVGMHRSGTSMIARLLNLCGLYLGRESDLMPPSPDNLDGYWENLNFVRVSEDVLNALGADWDYPPPAEAWADEAALDPLLGKAQLVLDQFAGREPWGWKDPRASLTLPFWERLLPKMPVVLCLRNPLEVAASLRLRHHLSMTNCFALWTAYNERVLDHCGPKQRIVTHYDAYFHRPHVELRRLLAFLDVEASENISEEACSAASLQLRNNRFGMRDLLETQAPPRVFELYSELCREADWVDDRGVQPGEQTLRPKQPDEPPDNDELMRLTTASASATDAVAQRDATIAELRETVERLRHVERNAVSQQETATEQSRRALERTRAELAEQSTAAVRATEAGAQRDATIAELRESLDTLREELATAVSGRDARIQELRSSGERLHAELAGKTEAYRNAAKALVERDSSIAELRAAIEMMRGELTTAVSQRDATIAELGATIEKVRAELTAVVSQRDATIEELRAELRAQIAERLAVTERAAATGARRDTEIAELEALREQLQDQASVADAFAIRERELREMLLGAHEQLARRDSEIAAVLPRAPRDAAAQELTARIQEVVRGTLPPNSTVLVVGNGDKGLLELDGRRAWHFPQTADGEPSGFNPTDGSAVISHLEGLRNVGGEYLLFPTTALFWLDHFADLKEYLEERCREVVNEQDTCVIYALCDEDDHS